MRWATFGVYTPTCMCSTLMPRILQAQPLSGCTIRAVKLHIFANINAPCDLTPSVTEELTITVNVGDDDGATDFGATSCNSNVGEPVNVTNGNVYLEQTDYRLPGIGDGLEITRTFNSRMKRAGWFGYGWSSILDESISAYDALTLRLNLSDGRAVYFTRPSTSDSFVPARPLDFHGVLVKNVDNTYTLTFKDGRTSVQYRWQTRLVR